VELAGGEPLLKFDLIKEIVKWAGKNMPRLSFAVQTNALLLTDEIIKFLSENRIGVGISLDGMPRINDAVRGGTSRILSALKRLADYGVGTNVTSVLTKKNIPDFSNFVLFCGSIPSIRVINLDLIRFCRKTDRDELVPAPEQIRKMAVEVKEILAFVNKRRFPPLKIRELDQIARRSGLSGLEPYCYAANGEAAAVAPDGSLYPCASLAGDPEFVSGTVDRPDPKKLKALSIDEMPDECGRCGYLVTCRGGCPARKWAYNQSLTRPCELECMLREGLACEVNP
jgi:uncharacterized protein